LRFVNPVTAGAVYGAVLAVPAAQNHCPNMTPGSSDLPLEIIERLEQLHRCVVVQPIALEADLI
jgi:hypothetical protein